MKGFNFSTIILGFVLVTLLISMSLIAFTMYKLSKVAATELAAQFYTANKTMLVIPTVSNVLGMLLIGVLVVMG